QGCRHQIRCREKDNRRLPDELMAATTTPLANPSPQGRRDQADFVAPHMAAPPILSVNNIEVVYDHVILVLKGVSLGVPRGGIVALLGANGAGKTTTLKAISNLLHSERGEVTKGSI